MLPAVLAAACIALLLLGLGFNMMTLGGMAAAVGLVIDDAVVMLEHMVRRMQEHGSAKAATLLDAAAEMGKPLLGSTTATIVVFTPLAFISGVTDGFFKRSDEHTSELQSLMRISYAVFCLKNKIKRI